jgi:hypothetical protein
MQTEAEKRREAKEFEAYENRQEKPVDLTGSQELPEPVEPPEAGISDGERAMDGVMTPGRQPHHVTDPDEGTVNDVVNDHQLAKKSNDPYEGIEYVPIETEITHLRHPITRIVFPVNADIIKQKHLRPCDENGKLVPDNRIFSRFN